MDLKKFTYIIKVNDDEDDDDNGNNNSSSINNNNNNIIIIIIIIIIIMSKEVVKNKIQQTKRESKLENKVPDASTLVQTNQYNTDKQNM